MESTILGSYSKEARICQLLWFFGLHLLLPTVVLVHGCWNWIQSADNFPKRLNRLG